MISCSRTPLVTRTAGQMSCMMFYCFFSLSVMRACCNMGDVVQVESYIYNVRAYRVQVIQRNIFDEMYQCHSREDSLNTFWSTFLGVWSYLWDLYNVSKNNLSKISEKMDNHQESFCLLLVTDQVKITVHPFFLQMYSYKRCSFADLTWLFHYMPVSPTVSFLHLNVHIGSLTIRCWELDSSAFLTIRWKFFSYARTDEDFC